MNISWSKLKEKIFFDKYQTPKNTRKLCFLTGWSSIFTCCVFYVCLILNRSNFKFSSFNHIVVLTIMVHLYISAVMIKWSMKYQREKLPMWSTLSLLFLFPFGLGLIFKAHKNKNWSDEENEKQEDQSVLHSLANSLNYLSNNLLHAMKWLEQHYPQEITQFLQMVQLPKDQMESWPNKAKFLIIAMYQALKQTKKKNTFEDLVFHGHWYDNRRFDFAILDPKSKLMPIKYKYSMAFIVLDEVNNYQKILNAKKEIKENIKFGPAKMICLHWGKGFKFYVNA